jgi:uncharacterized radical SAM superfamily Fe-S cluster-containing enzyme
VIFVERNLIRRTESVCPECLKVIPAEVFERGGKVWISKTCPEHGDFEEIYWSSYKMYKKAEKYAHDGKGIQNPNLTKENPVCPVDCGLCSMHKSHTALSNVVLTTRCDRDCFYCFFYAGRLGYVYEPTMKQISDMMDILRNEKPVPCTALQLTGGEPTLREDLLDIIRLAKRKGFDHVQLNTNGIRISRDLEFTRRVREAGVNTLYLSFDGMDGETNIKNHWEIPGVLDNCRRTGMGIVLVPTVIKGVNDHQLGDILKFGFRNNDVVRSVNFQPVSLVGKMPRKDRERSRITIPDTIKSIEEQTNGEITEDDFYPVPTISAFTRFVEGLTGKPQYDLSSHFACGMATYVFNDKGKMVPIPKFFDVDGFLEYLNEKADELEVGKSRVVVGSKILFRIGSFVDKEKAPEGLSLSKILYNALVKHDYKSLGVFHKKSLFIGMMHFQDLYNYDIERVKRCCIHYAMSDGRIIPFCAFNVIPEWYRDRSQQEQGVSFEEWERKTGKSLSDDAYKRDAKALISSDLYRKTYG